MDIDDMDQNRDKRLILQFENDNLRSGELGAFVSTLSSSTSADEESDKDAIRLEPSGPVLTEAQTVSGSYLSAEFAAVQAVDKHKSLLILRFQCHPAIGYRFSNAKVTWKFRPQTLSGPGVSPSQPKVILLAPRKSFGGCSHENRRLLWSLKLPIQVNAAGNSIRAEPSRESEVNKVVEHALTFTGTARGAPVKTSCVWTVEEDKIGGYGIPSHFQLAVVLEHEGPFVTELDVKAELKGGMSWSRWVQSKKAPGGGGILRIIDVEKWKSDIDEHETYKDWKKIIEGMTGEVEGAVVTFKQHVIGP